MKQTKSGTPISVGLFFDHVAGLGYAKFLEGRGYNVKLFQDGERILGAVKSGEVKEFDVLIIHAGLNIRTERRVDAEDICRGIRKEMDNAYIRIGIIGGAFPNEGEVFGKAGADFYATHTDFASRWVRKQIEKGPKTPEEIEKGKENFSTIPPEEEGKLWDEAYEEGDEGAYKPEGSLEIGEEYREGRNK